MYTIDDFNELNEEISNLLNGKLIFEGDIIKWEFDSLGSDLDEEELEEILDEDKDTIIENSDLDESCFGSFHIESGYIYCYIEF